MRRLRQLRPARRDAGMTLIELLVTMILMGVVSTLVVVAVSQASHLFIRTDDEARGLADAKVVFDRIARDIRESRGVVCDGLVADPTPPPVGVPAPAADLHCDAHLQLWIDSNSDYVKQPSEIVTWRLERDPDGVHRDVYRITGADGTPQTKQLQASSLIVDTLFTYFVDTSSNAIQCDASPDPCAAQRVDVVLTYDAIQNLGSNPRTVEASARLRNKG